MSKFQKYLEMAVPRKQDLAKRYYHGTNKVEDANDIIKNGIKPPDLTLVKKNKLTPREGKIYITPDIGYAQIYAIGGDFAGSKLAKVPGKYGFLFVVNGKDLKDIEPDEDGVGETLNKLLNQSELNIKEDRLVGLARRVLTPLQFKKLQRYDDYADLAAAGKKIIPSLDIDQKFYFIDKGAHIAHTGTIKPSEAWKIDLNKIPLLVPDGSNFFYHAEKIK